MLKRHTKFARFACRSFSQLSKEENITSITQKIMSSEDLVRELILSEHVSIDENKIKEVVQRELSSFNVAVTGILSDKKVLEKSLRGYLSVINELLFKRFFLLKKIQEAFDQYIQVLSKS